MPRCDTLLTGWTGNTGASLLQLLREQHPDWRIVGVSRSDAPERRHRPDAVECADLSDTAAAEQIFARHDIQRILHLANIRQSISLMTAADRYKVPRAVLVHTTGMYSRYQQYGGLYREIEDKLAADPPHTPITILRPTMIYGNTDETRDHNMHKLVLHLSRARWFPLFGDGSGKMQPVHIEDVASACLDALKTDRSIGQSYEISGGSVISFREVLNLICEILGRKPAFISIPFPIAVPLAAVYERLAPNPRVTVEQVRRLSEDKCYSHEAAARDLNFRPRSFEEGIREEIAGMRREGLIP